MPYTKNIIKIKLSLLIFIFLINYSAFSQEKKGIVAIYGAENEILPKKGDTIKEYYKNTKALKYVKYIDKEYLYIIGYYEDGTKDILKRFPLSNLKDKTLTFYYNNGSIKKVANYISGRASGKFTEYYKNEVLKSIKYYNRIRKDSIWSFFNKDGQLLKKEFYDMGRLLKKESYDKGVLLKKEEYN